MDAENLAFSYIRFSSDKQHLGDSLRRQVSLAEQYAAAHGLRLDNHTYRDLGVSAYRGRNAVQGKLFTFLTAIDSGLIKSNVFLLVESLDRLSRNDVDEALELFLSIIRRGVSIVTLSDNQIYNTASLKRDRGISLIISITIMMRANEESSMKSIRSKEAWRAKAAAGRLLTRMCPSWLEHKDGEWIVRQNEADIVRKLFKLASKGHGALTICRKLNDGGTPTLGRSGHWSPSTVTRILQSTAVYGTLTRHKAHAAPIENYYPPIVSRESFFNVRQLSSSRAAINVRADKLTASNLFRGTCFCARCDSRVFSVAGHKEQYQLQCYRSYAHGGCSERSIKGIWLEKALLEEMLQSPTRQNKNSDSVESIMLEQARHLCAALCGGRANAADHATIRKRLQELFGRIISRITIDAGKQVAVLEYAQGQVAHLNFSRM